MFGDFNFSAGYNDSVLRDASARKDAIFPSHLGLGWRGKFRKSTYFRTYYRFSYKGFLKEAREIYHQHSMEALLRQKLYRQLSFSFNFEGEFLKQPQLTQFDSNRFVYEPGLEWRIFLPTLVKAAFSYEKEDYPNFDLDSTAPGFKASIEQELTLYGKLSALYSQRTKDYSERRLYLNRSGDLAQAMRKDQEKEFQALLEGDWKYGGLQGGFSWADRNSNANFLDFGPNQSQSQNTNLADDELIPDYYSYTSRAPFVSGNLNMPGKLLFSVLSRWTELEFSGRVAKDRFDEFVEDRPKRMDRRHFLSLSLTRFQTFKRLTLGWTIRWDREQSTSNDFLYTFVNNRFLLAFRGFF